MLGGERHGLNLRFGTLAEGGGNCDTSHLPTQPVDRPNPRGIHP